MTIEEEENYNKVIKERDYLLDEYVKVLEKTLSYSMLIAIGNVHKKVLEEIRLMHEGITLPDYPG
tara:strand:+ start:6484 stop:6678 length:195 start_codon:yes stop_codon:yes gene_type:complete